MNKLILFVIFVLITGVMTTIVNDVFALSDKGMEKGKSTGCLNGQAKNNKHCNVEPIPTNTCDVNNDGKITADELPAEYTISFIHAIEQTVMRNGGNTNDNNIIDTLDEWNQAQIEQPGFCL